MQQCLLDFKLLETGVHDPPASFGFVGLKIFVSKGELLPPENRTKVSLNYNLKTLLFLPSAPHASEQKSKI